jgi:hypothetical protein
MHTYVSTVTRPDSAIPWPWNATKQYKKLHDEFYTWLDEKFSADRISIEETSLTFTLRVKFKTQKELTAFIKLVNTHHDAKLAELPNLYLPRHLEYYEAAVAYYNEFGFTWQHFNE